MRSYQLGNYTIWEDGRVISNFTGNEMKHSYRKSKGNQTYPAVQLHIDKKHKYFLLHRLLAEGFIPNPNNLPQINHKDGNGLNFALDNLEWCTPGQNLKHAHDTGLFKPNYAKGTQIPSAVINEEIARKIKYEHKGMTQKQRGALYGISRSAVQAIDNNKNWKHV